MAHPYRRWLTALGLLLSIVVFVFMVAEPFLNLPPFWEQLDVGVALTGYGILILLGVLAANRRLWPMKWRLSRKSNGRPRFMQLLIAATWGIDEGNDSGE